jgi:hypothetical protein
VVAVECDVVVVVWAAGDVVAGCAAPLAGWAVVRVWPVVEGRSVVLVRVVVPGRAVVEVRVVGPGGLVVDAWPVDLTGTDEDVGLVGTERTGVVELLAVVGDGVRGGGRSASSASLFAATRLSTY